MGDYTLERGHFAKDEEDDEDSTKSDGPEQWRKTLWCGLRLDHGFYEDIRK